MLIAQLMLWNLERQYPLKNEWWDDYDGEDDSDDDGDYDDIDNNDDYDCDEDEDDNDNFWFWSLESTPPSTSNLRQAVGDNLNHIREIQLHHIGLYFPCHSAEVLGPRCL